MNYVIYLQVLDRLKKFPSLKKVRHDLSRSETKCVLSFPLEWRTRLQKAKVDKRIIAKYLFMPFEF